MYYYFSGMLERIGLDYAIVECSGVGYKLTVSANTLGMLSGKTGQNVRLYSYFAVREDAEELYGFYTEEEKEAFCLLITVSGIGPKAAMAICSVLNPEKLGVAIANADVKAISAASGVGKKSAERVILELKDKYSKNISLPEGSVTLDFASNESETSQGSAMSDATAVLVSLGYTRAEAAYALKDLSGELDCDTLVRRALNKLMK